LAERLKLYTHLIALSLEAATLHTERTRREREARALAELSKRIGETLELEEILERSLEFAVKSLQLERGILALYDDVREQTSIDREFFAYGFEAMSEPSLSISPESFERLVRRNQPILSNDVKASSRSYAAGPRDLGAEAFVMLPLSARGKPLGVLYLDTTRASLEIKEREVSLAQALAEQASLAIENARLFDEAVSRGRESQTRSAIRSSWNAVLSVFLRRCRRIQPRSAGFTPSVLKKTSRRSDLLLLPRMRFSSFSRNARPWYKTVRQ
jgi:two-component system, NarL family, sensor histidine kinase UhpB